jgi:hypothetical protein
MENIIATESWRGQIAPPADQWWTDRCRVQVTLAVPMDKQLVSTDIYDDRGPAELTGFIRLSRYDSPG